MTHILALDQGTTSSRALVVDRSGQVRGVAQREFRQVYPRPGWVEHDPEEIWASQLHVAREALERAGIDATAVAAIGITNQRETTVLWERRSGRPLGPAIVWQDRRTADLCDRLRGADSADEIRRRTGLEIDPYFSGTKIRWMLDRDPEIRRRAEAGEIAFGTIDTWLVWKLTGGRIHVTDPSNASRTLLFDIHRSDWSPWLLDQLGVPAAVLPAVMDTGDIVGETEPELLGRAIPVAALVGDQQAALFGQMCVEPGMVKNTYGTGCFLLMNTGDEPVSSRHGLLTTVAWRRSGRTTYALEGSVFIGGAVVQWLRDGLGLIPDAPAVETLASSVPDSAGVYCVPAFAGLGAPHWDAYARGTIVGLTRGTTAAHLARAALEGIAHQVADVVEAMHADSGIRLEELRVDGGAAGNELLLRIQAELLQIPVVRPANVETTAMGAAYLAGLATGLWRDVEELRERWRPAGRHDPSRDPGDIARERRGWRRAVARAGRWIEE